MLYPLKFNNIYLEKIWGGRDFQLFRDNLPMGHIGESWDVSAHPEGFSKITNGNLTGKTLIEAVSTLGSRLVGKRVCSPNISR